MSDTKTFHIFNPIDKTQKQKIRPTQFLPISTETMFFLLCVFCHPLKNYLFFVPAPCRNNIGHWTHVYAKIETALNLATTPCCMQQQKQWHFWAALCCVPAANLFTRLWTRLSCQSCGCHQPTWAMRMDGRPTTGRLMCVIDKWHQYAPGWSVVNSIKQYYPMDYVIDYETGVLEWTELVPNSLLETVSVLTSHLAYKWLTTLLSYLIG